MSEFIGSRISLISKSDIKYVGTLHEINSENSTVALENVESYGTEGRRGNPDEEIPPSDQIYDYIVFRGSDVKDLTIVEPPKENKPPPPQMPNDPAILGAARPLNGPPNGPLNGPPGVPPPPQGFQQPPPNQQWRGPQPPPFSPYGYPPPLQQQQQHSRFAPPGGPHGFPAPGGPQGYGMQYGPPPGWYPPQGFPPGGPPGPPGAFSPQPIGPPGQQTEQQKAPGQQQAPVGPPQRHNTPPQDEQRQELSAVSENKPSVSAKPSTPAAVPAPPPPYESKPDVAAATAPAQPPQQRPPPLVTRDSRVAVPLQAKAGNAATPQARSNPNASTQQQSASQAAAAAVAAAMAKLGPAPTQATRATGGEASVDDLTKRVGDMRTDDRSRQSRQPGPGGFVPGQRGGRGGRRPSTRETGTRPVEVPTADFDFEGSNAKFNKQDLVKQAIATGSPLGTPTTESELKLPLNGADSGAIKGLDSGAPQPEAEVVIPRANYNKSTSFFDNISSELKDRQTAQDEGKRMGGMEFRTEERKKNFETFGQGSVDNGYRGGFRGGRGRGRGFGGRGRGFPGARGGFAPRGGAGRGHMDGNIAAES